MDEASSDTHDLSEDHDHPPPVFTVVKDLGKGRIQTAATTRIKTRDSRSLFETAVDCSIPEAGASRAPAFRKASIPRVKHREWNDWRWQLRNRIRTLDRLETMLDLSPEERGFFEDHERLLPFGITPYYLDLLRGSAPGTGLRRSVIPSMSEFLSFPGESDDPLDEDADSPVPGLVHRYPDRVLFLVQDRCASYCRYCTRSRMVGHSDYGPNPERWARCLDYIRQNPAIRDVLLSGGDPLVMDDDLLDGLLARLKAIPHVEMVRIGTKVPAVLPQRITVRLARMLHKHHPLWMSLHFVHPDECTPEAARACARLADAGIPLGSQTVLLKGVNDDLQTMKRLMHGLLRMRVRPYYLYQCDPISGSSHLRTTVRKGLEIIQGLRGFTSGYAVPTYVIDAPGGGGKIPLQPDYALGREGDDLLLRNYEGLTFRYPDPLHAGGRGER